MVHANSSYIEATKTLSSLYVDYKNQGLVSIYFWGSIITSGFNPKTSDIDSVGLLSDDADFMELDKIRKWLPDKNPKLGRLQINFFYISELTREKPVRSSLARLATPEQVVFDFPNWKYVCGKKIPVSSFPNVTPEQYLIDQMKVVGERTHWAKVPKNSMERQYYCKSLAWLCHAIHRLDNPQRPFSWTLLHQESNSDTNALVDVLLSLRKLGWNEKAILKQLPYLFNQSSVLQNKFQLKYGV